ncbi:cytochrome P450 [Streptomyces botrytidirepellens]|uniref:Cytochrome P450 n=1 Tax=Streptomyces botrytidirepellens TaxID=2486417 RepID=A0A3M8WAS9_9ACTN|nr:cytochrome P450 [Streptomyces botrytidirepellens]RNG25123.1 cytochrome P450 [Streptomyces botrytidirepellens]
MTDVVPDYPFEQPNVLEPPREWAETRAACPVAHVRMPSGDVVGLLTGYEEVRGLLTDQRFSRNLDREGAARMSTTEDGGMFSRPAQGQVDNKEGPGHRRWRRLISRAFTVKKMEAWRPRVQEMADALVDDMVAKGSPADLRAALALPLPVRVICALLGAPSEDQDKFARWSEVLLTLTRYTQAEVDEAQRDFHAYASDLVEHKRAEPGDDLLSELTQISDSEDGRLSHDELISTAVGLLLAGHETTSNMILKMTAMLLSERERYEAVLADPGLVPGVVEEALRMDANGGVGIPRFITEDTEVSGVPVGAGSTLFVNLHAANRDERKFPDPDRFDPRRENNAQHLAFGAGPHFCVGQTLARVELQVVLGTFVRRLPELRLRDAPETLRIREGVAAGGFEDMWVTW